MANEGQPSGLEGLRERLPGEALLDDLTEQLDRTRRLLTSSPEATAEAALARFGAEREAEARIAVDLSATAPLAEPGSFLQAHRLVVHALEVLDREGSSNPPVSPRYGPLKRPVRRGVEFVAEYIVKSYAENTVDAMRRLYTRREPQALRGTPERQLLAQARIEVERMAPQFTGGGIGAPALVAGGAVVPLLASVSQYLGAIDFLSRPVLIGLFAGMFLLFAILSSILLTGAAVAHRRSNLIMRRPLAALWETVGHCGNPPHDDSRVFALVAVLLSAIIWVGLPIAGVAVYFVS